MSRFLTRFAIASMSSGMGALMALGMWQWKVCLVFVLILVAVPQR